MMRLVSIMAAMTLLPAGAAAAATDYGVNRSTAKSMDEFRECFLAAQAGASNDWWFVPNERGGVFSNDGGARVGNAYTLELIDSGSSRTLRMRPANPSSPPQPAVAEAIERCA